MSAHSPAEVSFRPIAVSIPDAMRLSSLGRSTIYDLMQAGELQTVKVGTRHLILFSSLERLLTPKTTAEAAL